MSTRLKTFSCCLFVFFGCFFELNLEAQISTFPYTEDFESGAGGWSSGGSANDWEMGQPSKSAITSAGSGQNCWVTGGLTGSTYNLSEASYVTSPVFDFTNLKHPYITALVFWESEWKYDGANVQYSVDGGPWTVIGTSGDTDCINAYWYNAIGVNYLISPLSSKSVGWSGNIQSSSGGCQGGHGYGFWVPARHCIAELAGKSNVKFRFAFGAGSSCNDFDGFGFDKVSIDEAPQQTSGGDFSFTCITSRQVSFTGMDATGCKNSYRWSFGDPESGASDSSKLQNPSHTFSAPGSYEVSMTLSNSCSEGYTITKQVSILGTGTSVQNIDCNHSTGTINLSVRGSTAPYSYNWSNGSTTKNIDNLVAGTYMVTVSHDNSCPAYDTATVSVVPPVAITVTRAAMCHADDGVITIEASGGIAPYTYDWGNGISSQNRDGLTEGTYTVTATDNGGCTATEAIVLQHPFDLGVVVQQDTTIRLGGSAILQAIANEDPVTYFWTPATGLSCDTCASVSASPPANTTYTVEVTDTNGCKANNSVVVTVVPYHVVFIPNSFTPNGDGNNDFFEIFGNIQSIAKLDLKIYNRWGELVFEADNANFKWDGTYKGEPVAPGTLTYLAQAVFSDGYVQDLKKGTITLIR